MNDRGEYDVRVRRTITIARTPQDLYRVWRSPRRLAGFMAGAENVRELDGRRSRWTVNLPGLGRESWEAQITDDRQNEAIGWKTIGQTKFDHSGLVTFRPAPHDLGTEVTLDIRSHLPGGAVANAVSKLSGRSPEDYVSHTLHNFKQLMETGEIASNRGPSGRVRIMTGVAPKIAMAGSVLAVLAGLLYFRRTRGEA